MIFIWINLFLNCFLLFIFSIEKLYTKTRMTAVERKRKSHENTFKKMTEEEREVLKEAEKERIRKAV